MAPLVLSDSMIAARFLAEHGQSFRFAEGLWFHWNGAAWEPDREGRVFDMVAQSCAAMAREYGVAISKGREGSIAQQLRNLLRGRAPP